MKKALLLPLLVLLLLPQAASAAFYESTEACQAGLRAGDFAGEVVLDCYSCMQDRGSWEYRPGSGEELGRCHVGRSDTPVTGVSDNDLRDYRKTDTPCTLGGNACGWGICVAPEGSSAGYCYAHREGLVNLLKVGTLPELLSLVLRVLVQVGTMLLVLFLVWTGFKFVAAQGNEEEIRNARSALMWVVIGGLLLLGAQALSLVLQAAIASL